MSGPHRLTGIPASHGYAKGPMVGLDAGTKAYAAKGSPAAEARALAIAIEGASEQLAALATQMLGEAADMLEFQLAMLADESLAAPAFAAIEDGALADRAWLDALDVEIAGYEASEDDYFRARSADLRDIRQQVLDVLAPAGDLAVPSGAILVGDDIAPTRFLAVDWSQGGGIALAKGSSASHVAMLARARGVPMVVGLGPVPSDFDLPVFLDAEHGHVLLGPGDEAEALFHRAAEAFAARWRAAEENSAKPAATADGTPVRVLINVADPSDVERIDVATCDGIGLMRTEFLFGKSEGLPDEETQYRAYRKVLEWAAGEPVTIRTVDAGGDKPVPGYTVEEGNPFLGLRGIRLSLARPEIFRVQIRALLRAAVHANLKVMFPMISVPEEYTLAAALFAEEADRLAKAGIEYAMPPLGIMVEVPSVAIAPELFSDVAFFSIGSNDLTQYVMAAARDNTAVAALNSVHNPAVLRLIASVAAFGQKDGIPVSLCGDAGGDPAAIPALLEAGLRDLSVVPAQLALAKTAVAGVSL
ncbi:phosphoenolpyruvate--protein phosphotransferase [Mesorhizobium sp. LHD-90]|uniref:phosphoenolpyruvate--protein phosphotransferase n=1 Tax=Mesorhizobium sp. LHD-90 TaxID=3071414 RepID=UPI0027E1DD8D|nr:phosphoenolpyruvate--protein phosphotransferase [Mesorhizobium sp. LHD-90]MDQ6435301.1 phosphoenolpyruvate--protein phosphotransferase [Mesorhizobium sp. LHD-90]